MFSIINLSQDASKASRYISTTLIGQIETTLAKWEKVLLYLNKRGSHAASVCRDCGYIWMCPHCDVMMKVHQKEQKLLCHICSHSVDIPHTCPSCWGQHIEYTGVGTQHIETVLRSMFPHIKIYRFDSDSLRTAASRKEALSELNEADIVIGTKMMTTGFNLQKIWCIAVILVESENVSLHYDSEEKSYQNLKQLIGRGNRLGQKTEILLQTFSPNQRIIKRLTEQWLKEIISEWLTERKDFHYPPYYEIVTLSYRDEDAKKSVLFMQSLLEKYQNQKQPQEIQILYGASTFKKNNEYYTSAILKWKHIRESLEILRSDILKNPKLSVVFSS